MREELGWVDVSGFRRDPVRRVSRRVGVEVRRRRSLPWGGRRENDRQEELGELKGEKE